MLFRAVFCVFVFESKSPVALFLWFFIIVVLFVHIYGQTKHNPILDTPCPLPRPFLTGGFTDLAFETFLSLFFRFKNSKLLDTSPIRPLKYVIWLNAFFLFVLFHFSSTKLFIFNVFYLNLLSRKCSIQKNDLGNELSKNQPFWRMIELFLLRFNGLRTVLAHSLQEIVFSS